MAPSVPDPGDVQQRLARTVQFARLLDSKYRIPFTPIRIGLDGIVGLLPVAGDAVMAAVSLVVVFQAWRCGVGAGVIGRMLVNIAIDAGVGSIPVAGDVFDIWFKPNDRNAALLRRALDERGG